MTHYAPIFNVRLVREGEVAYESAVINSPELAAGMFQDYLAGVDREHFVLMGLNAKNRCIGINTVSIGILNQALVHPREVFKPAILMNADSVIVCHNHPSGDPTPSPEDRQVTARLAEAGKILGIDLVDSIVIGGPRWASLKQLGWI